MSSLGPTKGKHRIVAIRREAKQDYTVTRDGRKTNTDFELEKQ